MMSNSFNDKTLEDVIALGDKDALAEYALAVYGEAIDRQKPFDGLVEELRQLDAAHKAKTERKPRQRKVEEPRRATHLLNRTTGLYWPRTPLLEARGDLAPCDAEGNPL